MKMLKQGLRILPRTKNKILLAASKIIDLKKKLALMRASLITRLMLNDFTNGFLEELKQAYGESVHKKSIINELIYTSGKLDISKTIQKQTIRTKTITQEFKQEIKKEEAKHLRELLQENEKNSEKIYEIIKCF